MKSIPLGAKDYVIPNAVPDVIGSGHGGKQRTQEAPVNRRIQKLIQQTCDLGYVIIPQAFSQAQTQTALDELGRIRAEKPGPASDGGRNSFEGFRTSRSYALLDKTRALDAFPLHPDVLALNDYFLDPGYLVTAFTSVSILPGEKSQPLHTDDSYVTLPLPHRPFTAGVMIALDDFTETNGATVIVPKSHLADRPPQRADAIPVVMPKGSLIYYIGTLWHAGGQNRSDRDRPALAVQYCQPWLRQIENQCLAVSWDKLDQMPERLVDMLGYKIGTPFLGYVDGIGPRKAVKTLLERYRRGAKAGDSRL